MLVTPLLARERPNPVIAWVALRGVVGVPADLLQSRLMELVGTARAILVLGLVVVASLSHAQCRKKIVVCAVCHCT